MRHRKSLWVLIAVLWLLPWQAQAVVIEEVASDKGAKAWLTEAHALPIFSLRLTFPKAGSAYDPDAKKGLALMAARMLQEGSGGKDAKAFQEYLDFHAIDLDIAVSEDDVTVSMESLSEHTDVAFSILYDILLDAQLAPEAFTQLQKEAISELKQLKQNPSYVAGLAFDKLVFGDHPYGAPGRGTKESIQAIQLDDVREYLTSCLTREGMVLSVVGDMTPAMLAAKMSQYLDPLPEVRQCTGVVVKASPHFGSVGHEGMDVPQTVVKFALPGVPRQNPEFYTAFVLNHMLGGNGLSSRVGTAIRKKNGLAYYAYTSLDNMDQAALLKGVFASRAEEKDKAVALLKEAIGEAQANGFAEEEFDDAILFLTGSFPLKLDANYKLVEYLQMMQRFDLGKDYLEMRNRIIESVTLRHVNALAKRILDPEKLILQSVGQEPKTAPETESTNGRD